MTGERESLFPFAQHTMVKHLWRWADAREDRNTPGGHGTTGTALLRDAADRVDALEQLVIASRWILSGNGDDRSDRDVLRALWHLLLPDAPDDHSANPERAA